MIYYIIDVRFPKAFRRSVELNKHWVKEGDKYILEHTDEKFMYHFVYPNQTMKTIVQDTKKFILQAKIGYRSIDMLRLCGHGDSGQLQLGEGLREWNAGEFSELAGFMKPDLYNVGVEIHGCGVASDTSVLGGNSTINNPICIPGSAQNGDRGLNLLKKLARAINRNVKAGVNCQQIYTQYDDWKFEGPTITAKPDGNHWLK